MTAVRRERYLMNGRLWAVKISTMANTHVYAPDTQKMLFPIRLREEPELFSQPQTNESIRTAFNHRRCFISAA